MEVTDSNVVVFTLNDRRLALPLTSVLRIVRIAAIDPLPGAPSVVAGVVNVRGEVLPVLSLRERFGMATREVELSDHLVLVRRQNSHIALWVDSVSGVSELGEQSRVAAETIFPGLRYLRSVAKDQDGLVLIQDLDAFLSAEEVVELEAALEQSTTGTR